MVADALDICRYLEARHNDTQIVGNGLLLGNQQDAAVLDIDDHIIQDIVCLHHFTGQLRISRQQGFHGQLHLCAGLIAHHRHFFLYDIQLMDVFLPRLFHISQTSQ